MQTQLIRVVLQALVKLEERNTVVADIEGKINSHGDNVWCRLHGDGHVVKPFSEDIVGVLNS